MIRNLRAYFLGRVLREKLLLLAFIVLAALIWLSSFARRGGQMWRDHRATTSQLKDQAMWISNKGFIDEQARRAAAQLDPAKTLDGVKLVGAVNQAAAEAGLRDNFTTSLSGTQANGQFAVNTATCDVRNAPYEAIQKLYQQLQQRAPYIGIEQFSLQSNRANPSQLSLTLKVSSVEIAR